MVVDGPSARYPNRSNGRPVALRVSPDLVHDRQDACGAALVAGWINRTTGTSSQDRRTARIRFDETRCNLGPADVNTYHSHTGTPHTVLALRPVIDDFPINDCQDAP